MAKITLDLNRFKASGVYTIEFDASERIVVSTQTIRLIVGFSRKGPFNGPVFLRDVSTSRKVFGSIDSFLEKRGSYFHRALETCLQTAPVFGLNLLPLNDTPVNEGGDAVDYRSFAISASEENGNKTKALLSSFYNKERFWFPDESYLQATVDSKPANRGRLLNFVNLGQEVQSVIIRKSDNASLYNVTANDYYGRGNVPAYIQPNDYISDYFIDVYVVKGDWTNLQLLTQDPLYSKYFDLRGVKADKFFEFLSLDGITMTGSFSGTIIPDFIDNNGSNQSINVILNSAVALTGIFCDLNKDMFDDYDNSTYKVDMVGNSLINGTDDIIDFLSYNTPIKSILTFTGSLPTTAGGFDPVVQNTDTAVSPIIYVKSHSFGGARGKFNNVLVIPKPYPSDTTFTVSMYDALTAALTNSSLIKTLGTDTINDSRQPNDFVKIANVIDTGSSLEIQLSSPAHEDTAYENTSSDYAESNYILKSNATVIPSVANSITINNPLFGDAITGIGADTQTTPYGQAIATVTPSASSQVTPIGQQLVTATVDAGSSGALVGQPIQTITTPAGTDFGQVLATITAQTGTNPGRPLSTIGTATGTAFGQAIDTIGSQSGVDFGQAIQTFTTPAGTDFGQGVQTINNIAGTLVGQGLALTTATYVSGGAGAIATVATYTALPVVSSGTGSGAFASVTTDVTGAITGIVITTSGTGYKATDTITIAAGWDTAAATAITITATFVPSTLYTGLSATGGAVNDATFSVIRNAAGANVVAPTTPGTGYLVTDTLTISGTLIGGATPANDITFDVNTLVPILYSGVASTGGTVNDATFDVNFDSAGVRTITIANDGTGYLVSNVLTIDGSDVGGATTTNDITFNVATLVAISYPALASTSAGLGTGATFTVAYNNLGVRTVTRIAGGTGYLPSAAITISGSLVGGSSTNNITFNVATLVAILYPAVASTGGGNNATFDVAYNNLGVRTVTPVAAGTGFFFGTAITINGSLVGGATPANNITFSATAVVPIAFPAVASSATGGNTSATFTVSYDANGAQTVTIVAPGTSFLLTDTITILGGLIGGANTTNDITFNPATLVAITYPARPSTSAGLGTGATFDVAFDTAGVRTVTLVAQGTGYLPNAAITISGAVVGGSAPTNNITFNASALVAVVYSPVASTVTSGGAGTGATFTVTYNSAGVRTITVANPAAALNNYYLLGDVIKIDGSVFSSNGGVTSTNDVILNPTTFTLKTFLNVATTSSQNGINATLSVTYSTLGIRTVALGNNAGIKYRLTDLLTISAALVGGLHATAITINPATLVPSTYPNVSSTCSTIAPSQPGSGATFTVTYNNLGVRAVAIVYGGTGYTIGDTITIPLANVGGVPATNITFGVTAITPGPSYTPGDILLIEAPGYAKYFEIDTVDVFPFTTNLVVKSSGITAAAPWYLSKYCVEGFPADEFASYLQPTDINVTIFDIDEAAAANLVPDTTLGIGDGFGYIAAPSAIYSKINGIGQVEVPATENQVGLYNVTTAAAIAGNWYIVGNSTNLPYDLDTTIGRVRVVGTASSITANAFVSQTVGDVIKVTVPGGQVFYGSVSTIAATTALGLFNLLPIAGSDSIASLAIYEAYPTSSLGKNIAGNLVIDGDRIKYGSGSSMFNYLNVTNLWNRSKDSYTKICYGLAGGKVQQYTTAALLKTADANFANVNRTYIDSTIYTDGSFTTNDAAIYSSLAKNISESITIESPGIYGGGKKFKLTSVNATKLEIGDYVVNNDTNNPILVRVTGKIKKLDTSTGLPYYEYTVLETPQVTITGGISTITKFAPIQKFCDRYQFTRFSGFNLTDFHLPGTPAQLEKIYGVLETTNLAKTLADKDVISFRYIIDTFNGGLEPHMGPKQYLSRLAKNRQKCMALLNAPSIAEFQNATDPRFTDLPDANTGNPKPVLNTSYISTGGNLSLGPSYIWGLPDEDQGAKFIGVFSPNIIIRENNKNVSVPPAADVSNNFIRKFVNGTPFAIVAGPRRGVISNPKFVKMEYDFLLTDRENLEPIGVNPIVTVKNVGPMIFANQTAYQRTLSAFNNLHVRDLLITVEESVEEILGNYLFEFNDASTRLEIRSIVETYLDTVRNAGGVYDYAVIMDDTNNTPAIIDQNFGIIDIAIEPARGIQKFISRITILKTGTISSGGFSAA